MKSCLAPLLCLLTGLAQAAPATWYVTPFAGYASELDFNSQEDTPGLHAESAGLWGLALGRQTDDPGSMELLFSQQVSRLSPAQPDRLTLRYLHFAGALHADSWLKPYVSAGVGLTHFQAYQSKLRPSLALAVGIQPHLARQLALRAELRGYGTLIDDDSQFLCDPQQCDLRIQGELLPQLQANLGLTFLF
ncbi:MAG: porin family protein [Aeromonadaceae bacterium]|nr:porin family protein [Aeromonadaceae bacterium]